MLHIILVDSTDFAAILAFAAYIFLTNKVFGVVSASAAHWMLSAVSRFSARLPWRCITESFVGYIDTRLKITTSQVIYQRWYKQVKKEKRTFFRRWWKLASVTAAAENNVQNKLASSLHSELYRSYNRVEMPRDERFRSRRRVHESSRLTLFIFSSIRLGIHCPSGKTLRIRFVYTRYNSGDERNQLKYSTLSTIYKLMNLYYKA